ncbi:Carbonic anhydrase [Termitomyces sp. T112]|nr:hypothetical protein C0989_000964 [Termitomyces sp. Mn162]KAG5731569.1 Carbonic anhydrase [Termitomyces sp. T112]KAH0578556.1 hypothetical protein H2248_003703 [Termitomyces sp. 'cryptogamus']
MQLSLVLLIASLCALFPAYTAAAGRSTASSTHFSYTGIDGPLGWTKGDDVNPKCSTGTNQSPINIDSTICVTKSHVKLSIPNARLNFTNNGHTLFVATGGSLSIGAENYQLVQFHFHTPAEHLINDEFFPLEMHLVFKAAGAQPTDPFRLVIGVLFETWAFSTTELLRVLAHTLPREAGTSVITRRLIFEPLISHIEKEGLYTYQGSLTTPPCDEGITWLVSKKTMDVNLKTYKAFKEVIKFNARYVQNTPGEKNLITFAKDNYPTTA